jgi:hypothetical protein
MESDQAKHILKSLADGRDPATGQSFPPDSPYQQADTVRALFLALEALERGGKPARRRLDEGGAREPRVIDTDKPMAGMPRRSSAAAKAGGAWSPEEEQQLRDEFAAHKPFPENLPFEAKEASFASWRSRVAAAHGRTAGGITSRLVKLGLIEDNHRNRVGQGNRPPDRATDRSGNPRSHNNQFAPPRTPQMPTLTDEEKRNLPF